MLAEILAIGKEILVGKTVDTNSNWLARQLNDIGFRVKRIVVLDDVEEEIAQELLSSIKYGVQLIVTTGGLGPTPDDKTLKAVSRATGRKLALNKKALDLVKERYEYFYKKGFVDSPYITADREKMAYLPDGGEPIPNNVGAACGLFLKLTGCIIVSLPGVPKEMQSMFSEFVKPRLKEFLYKIGKIKVKAEKTIESGIKDESLLSPIIRKVMDAYPKVYVKSLPESFGKDVNIKVRFMAEADARDEAEALVNKAVDLFLSLVSEIREKDLTSDGN